MATEEKEISGIGEDMPLIDKDYENNKLFFKLPLR